MTKELKDFLKDKTIQSTLFEPSSITLFFSDDSQITFQAKNEKDFSDYQMNLKVMAQKSIKCNI